MKKNSFLTFGRLGAVALLLSLSAAYAEDQPAAVKQNAIETVAGVKQEAVPQVKPVTETPPPASVEVKPVTQTPPPTSVEVKPVTQTPPPPPPPTSVEVKPVTQTPPPPPPPTAVEIKPVTQAPPPPPPPTAVEIKPVTQAPPPPPPPQVNKIDGIHTPPPPPVSVVKQAGTIQAINGVTGLNTDKLKNLEAALILKQAAETPKTGAEHDGKGKAAAAALLSVPGSKPAPQPGKDGRDGFHEFEKLQNRGS